MLSARGSNKLTSINVRVWMSNDLHQKHFSMIHHSFVLAGPLFESSSDQYLHEKEHVKVYSQIDVLLDVILLYACLDF